MLVSVLILVELWIEIVLCNKLKYRYLSTSTGREIWTSLLIILQHEHPHPYHHDWPGPGPWPLCWPHRRCPAWTGRPCGRGHVWRSYTAGPLGRARSWATSAPAHVGWAGATGWSGPGGNRKYVSKDINDTNGCLSYICQYYFSYFLVVFSIGHKLLEITPPNIFWNLYKAIYA